MTFTDIVGHLNDIAWGPWMLILLVGTGIYLSARTGFLQFRKFGYAMKKTIGKSFQRQTSGAGEVTPFQAMTTALAATVGTGNMTQINTIASSVNTAMDAFGGNTGAYTLTITGQRVPVSSCQMLCSVVE